MSALQASRKYGVPSRTLYDKVKKMGILTANMQKQLQQKNKSSDSTPQKQPEPSSFSPLALLGMQLPQAGLPSLPPLQPVPPELDSKQPVNGDAQQSPSFTSKSSPASQEQEVTFFIPRSFHAVDAREDKSQCR